MTLVDLLAVAWFWLGFSVLTLWQIRRRLRRSPEQAVDPNGWLRLNLSTSIAIETYMLGDGVLLRLAFGRPIIVAAFITLDWGGLVALAILFLGFNLLVIRDARQAERRHRAAADAPDHS